MRNGVFHVELGMRNTGRVFELAIPLDLINDFQIKLMHKAGSEKIVITTSRSVYHIRPDDIEYVRITKPEPIPEQNFGDVTNWILRGKYAKTFGALRGELVRQIG